MDLRLGTVPFRRGDVSSSPTSLLPNLSTSSTVRPSPARYTGSDQP